MTFPFRCGNIILITTYHKINSYTRFNSRSELLHTTIDCSVQSLIVQASSVKPSIDTTTYSYGCSKAIPNKKLIATSTYTKFTISTSHVYKLHNFTYSNGKFQNKFSVMTLYSCKS